MSEIEMPELREPRDMDDNEEKLDLNDAIDNTDAISRQYQDEETVEFQLMSSRARAAASQMVHTISEQGNMSFVVRIDRSYFSDMQGRDPILERSAQGVHGEIGNAPPRGRLVTRWKFWSVVLPMAVSIVTSLPFSIIATVWASRQRQASEAQPNADLPPDVKDLLKKKAEEWSNMPISEAFLKISELSCYAA